MLLNDIVLTERYIEEVKKIQTGQLDGKKTYQLFKVCKIIQEEISNFRE